MPQEVVYDSCYYASTLLKIEVKNYKVVSIEFSDNAEEWMIKALNKIKDNGKINYNKFDSAIKKEGIKNCIFIFPTVIQSLFSCRNYFLRNDHTYNRKYFQFNKKYLSGKVIIRDPVGQSFYRPVS